MLASFHTDAAEAPRNSKQHCTQLESNSYSTPADFLVMLIVSGAALLVMGAFMGMPFLGMGLDFSIVYVWAKENADQEVNFVFNLAKFKAFYLPWAYVGLAMLMGQSPVPHLMGIAAGHFYVFLDKIVPAQYNRTLLWTPAFLCDSSFVQLQLSGRHLTVLMRAQTLIVRNTSPRRCTIQSHYMVRRLQLGWRRSDPWPQLNVHYCAQCAQLESSLLVYSII